MRWIALACVLLSGCYGHRGRQKHEDTTSAAAVAKAYAVNPVRADERYDDKPLVVKDIKVASITDGHIVTETPSGSVWVELGHNDLVAMHPGVSFTARCDGAKRARSGQVVLVDCEIPY